VIHIGFSKHRRLWILHDPSKGKIMFSMLNGTFVIRLTEFQKKW
jgi:hypothetical protein